MEITVKIHSTCLDKEYGKYDVAPRIASPPSADNVGYLLAYRIEDGKALVLWDDDEFFGTVCINPDDFVVIG